VKLRLLDNRPSPIATNVKMRPLRDSHIGWPDRKRNCLPGLAPRPMNGFLCFRPSHLLGNYGIGKILDGVADHPETTRLRASIPSALEGVETRNGIIIRAWHPQSIVPNSLGELA
jgi:hypothetical protein